MLYCGREVVRAGHDETKKTPNVNPFLKENLSRELKKELSS